MIFEMLWANLIRTLKVMTPSMIRVIILALIAKAEKLMIKVTWSMTKATLLI